MDTQINLLLETGGAGAGRHVLDLYRGLRNCGWMVRLILSNVRIDQQFARELKEIEPNDIFYISARRSPHWTDLPALLRIRKCLESSSYPQLLHAHSTKAGILGVALKRHTVGRILTPHAYRGMDPTLSPLQRSILKTVERGYSRAYDRVIAVSEGEREYAVAIGCDPNRVRYIPNGLFSAESIPPERRSRSEGAIPRVGFVGRLVPQKNPSLFLETVRAIRARGESVQAVVVGDGPLRETLVDQAKMWGLDQTVEWRGSVRGQDAMSDIDVLVHTSLYESFPYVLLEAAAAMVPIVAVVNDGSRAILGGMQHSALLVNATPELLAGAVTKLMLPGPERSNHLESLDIVNRQFTAENMLAKTIEVYTDVIHGSE